MHEGGEIGRPQTALEDPVMPIRIFHLEARDAARMKLGARGISVAEARQLLRNRHETVHESAVPSMAMTTRDAGRPDPTEEEC